MMKPALIASAALLVFSAAVAFAQTQPPTPNLTPAAAAPRRVHVDEATAAAMLVQKSPLTYPESARKARIEGKVVLRIVVGESGDVKEVTVVSGDPLLGQAAADAVKQRKYKPYLLDGSPAEMETQAIFNFALKPSAPAPVDPPLGSFRENAYSNDYFGVYYPLSSDWVRETDLMRKRLASEGNNLDTYVLLAAVHIPQNTEPLRADSSFTVYAISNPDAHDCRGYLERTASNLQSQKEGKQKGDISHFTIAGHDFYRVDFEFRTSVDHRTFLCAPIKDYLLRWNIVGWSRQAIETAVSTLNSMTAAPPPATPPKDSSPPVPESRELSTGSQAKKVQLGPGVAIGLLIKRVTPIYPQEAKNAHIQGTVRLKAVISKTGDVADLEVIDGPIDLAVSAVNAVRKWKYRPYLLNGEPVAVQTEITVNYSLQF
jgi:TonB family protein